MQNMYIVLHFKYYGCGMFKLFIKHILNVFFYSVFFFERQYLVDTFVVSRKKKRKEKCGLQLLFKINCHKNLVQKNTATYFFIYSTKNSIFW